MTGLLHRIGGEAGIVRLVDAFYAAMDALPSARTIRAMHDVDLRSAKAVLARYLSHWIGVQACLADASATAALARRHRHFDIDFAARGAWMSCMRVALAQTCVDTTLRAELEAAFSAMAEQMRQAEPAVPRL
ncbi:MAG: globin [Burkholderiales bacterium]